MSLTNDQLDDAARKRESKQKQSQCDDSLS